VSGERSRGVRSVRAIRVLLCAMATLLVAGRATAQQTHILVVTGVPGDAEHAEKFDRWAKTFIEAAKRKDAVPESNITYLAEKQATKPAVERALADLAGKAKPRDTVLVLLIGHGSFDGTVAAFNLPGPDLTAADYGKLLAKFGTTRVVFVNTASSSGAFLPALTAPGRVIITATKTGGERNETVFGEYFTAAFGDEAADQDRNGHVSIEEAFSYAKTKVTDAFKQKGLILTEHAVLEDGGEGKLAATVFLGTGRADTALNVDTSDPAVKALVAERDAIQNQIEVLQLRKASMNAADYEAQLEKLLTELARKTKAIRDLQVKK
jgi:Peptidase C13 family